MASFRKRSGRWQARITRKGNPDLNKTFISKEDALKWARATEREIETGNFLPHPHASVQSLGDLITRYRREVVPKLRGASTEYFRLKKIERQMGHLNITALNSTSISTYRDHRLEKMSPSACLRELQSLSAMFHWHNGNDKSL